jgi:phage shock protein E
MMTKYNSIGTIVDVRTPEEYEHNHVTGSINIPLEVIRHRISDFKEMYKPIVVYCRTGNRSGIAANLLKQYGIIDVINGGSIDGVKRLRQ